MSRSASGSPAAHPNRRLDVDIESARLHLKPEGGGRFQIVDRHHRQRLGQIALRASRHNRVRGLELTYEIDAPYRGRGFGSEAAAALVGHAFTEPVTSRIYASASWSNRASRRILEGLGMRQVDLAMLDWDSLMEDVAADGAERDEPDDLTPFARVEYEVLRQDWKAPDAQDARLA
jgi:RimJ/RimL family protein N-acetyltransferase